MTYLVGPGPFDAPASPPPPAEAALVGVVATDADELARYLESVGGVIGPYVWIRNPADVPERLGGVAVLVGDLGAELAAALERATAGP